MRSRMRMAHAACFPLYVGASCPLPDEQPCLFKLPMPDGELDSRMEGGGDMQWRDDRARERERRRGVRGMARDVECEGGKKGGENRQAALTRHEACG